MQFLPGGIVGLRAEAGAANKVNLGFVGVGGRGEAHVSGFAGQNFVAFCDVDRKRAASALAAHPQVPMFSRYREMLEKMGSQLDAVVISTADHSHFAVAKAAMELGKHVYVEKPLAQSVAQVRALKALALEKKVVTQMGNQGHSNAAMRRCREMVQAGLLGPVRRVECWTDRPVNWWVQGQADYPVAQSVPETLDWEGWLDGLNEDEFPYSEAVHPFDWRGFLAFGTGALGDMACHVMDGSVWALDLGAPLSVTAQTSGDGSAVMFPTSSRVTYRFPARGDMPELELIWSDGTAFPVKRPPQLEADRALGTPEGGYLIHGQDASMMGDVYSQMVEVFPSARKKELETEMPEESIPRVRSHWHDFLGAIRQRRQPSSSIPDSAANLTEIVLLGALAQRFPGETLEYDAATMTIRNHPAASAVLQDPRAGARGAAQMV